MGKARQFVRRGTGSRASVRWQGCVCFAEQRRDRAADGRISTVEAEAGRHARSPFVLSED